MSKRLDVLRAVKAMIVAALPGCDVLGLSDDAERPKRLAANGTAIVRDGTPDLIGTDLSPPLYHYEHDIPVELAAYQSTTDLRDRLDAMASPIGAAIAADPSLGGLCNHIEVTPLDMADLTLPGGAVQAGAEFSIIAHYHTGAPLG